MRALGYQDVLWNISVAPNGEGFAIAMYGEEHELFDGLQGRTSVPLFPIDLSMLLGRSAKSTDRWTAERVQTAVSAHVGRQLWEAVPPEVKDALPLGPQVRLKIASDVPAVGDLPWEWLTDGGPPFALRPGFTLVRSVPLRFPVPPISIDPPLRVLLVVPNPKDQLSVDAGREIDVAMQALGSAIYNVNVLDLSELEQIVAALATEPNIVHYIGHGGLNHGEGNVILQDANGRSRWVSATDVATRLPSSVRLLCLATPFTAHNYQVLGLSHLARATTGTPLPTTVANQYPIGEKPSAAFWSGFYSSLGSDGNVNDAIQAGRSSAATADPVYADWASFSLVVRDQTGVSFEVRPTHDAAERRAAEYRAQFAAEAANDLATQVQVLGDEASSGLKQQYAFEQKRATELLDSLPEE